MSRRPEKSAPPEPPHSQRRAVLAVCGLLLLAVWLVFGQTIDYGFVNYDDEMNLYGNPAIRQRPQRRRDSLGMDHHARKPVGADHLDVLSGRLPGLRSETRGLPSHERPSAQRHDHPAVPGSVANDRPALALCLCGRGLCGSSAARRIGRLAVGAEGLAQRAVLRADARGIRRVRSPPVLAQSVSCLSGNAGLFCPGTDVEADPGDAPLRASVVGLLAAGANVYTVGQTFLSARTLAASQTRMSAPPELVAFDRREDSLAAAVDRLLRDRALGARNSRHRTGENPVVGADRQRPGLVRRLPGRDVLAREFGRILSASDAIRCRRGSRSSRC